MFVLSPCKSQVTLFITTARADITGGSQHLPPVCPQFVQSPVSPRSHPVIPVTISDPGSFFFVLLERMLSVGGVESCLEKYPQSDWLLPPCVVSVTWWEEKTPDILLLYSSTLPPLNIYLFKCISIQDWYIWCNWQFVVWCNIGRVEDCWTDCPNTCCWITTHH